MNKKLRTKYWSIAGIWIACIYSTLSIVRPICEFLREILPFNNFINFIIAGLLLSFAIFLVDRFGRLRPSTLVLLSVVLVLYSIGIYVMKIPEERIHFIQYGILAFLIYRALQIDVPDPWSYLGAFILTSLFGWIDEGIQYLLPGRYYTNYDVLLNSVSSLLGLFMTYIFQRERLYTQAAKPKQGTRP